MKKSTKKANATPNTLTPAQMANMIGEHIITAKSINDAGAYFRAGSNLLIKSANRDNTAVLLENRAGDRVLVGYPIEIVPAE